MRGGPDGQLGPLSKERSYSSKEATLSTVNPVSRMIALRVPLASSL